MTDLAAPPDTPAPPRRSRRLTAVAVVALTVVVVLAAIGLLALATEPRASTAPSGGGRIAVVDGAGHLRTVDAAGGAERRYDLASLPSGFPAWSPDGEHLATVAVDGGDTALFVLDDAPSAATSGGLPDPVYRSPDEAPFYLYWSPDGRQLTFLTTEPDGLALRAVPADGSSPDAIVRRGAPMYWAWTADDRILLHAGGDGPDAYVGELGLNGSESRRAAVVPGQFQAPAVSADGQRRAYVISTAEPEPDIRSMVILDEDGRDGSIRRVAVRGPTALGWSPGQGGLGFIAPRQRDGLPVGHHVIAASAGTHGLAVAWASSLLGLRATVVVSEQASPAKIAKLRVQPIELILHGDSDAAEAYAPTLVGPGSTYVSPYNDTMVIAGQATVGRELETQAPGPLTVVVPVGGGGLLSGIGLWARGHDVDLVGVEACASLAVSTAVAAGGVTPIAYGDTLADGLAGNIEAGSVTVPLLAGVRFACVTEPELRAGMRWLMVHHGLVAEGAGAAAVAAVLAGKVTARARLIVLVTGRNVTPERYAAAIAPA